MNSASPDDADVVIVGAGMAGLTAARALVDAGLSVVVLDKGRAVGGRMATRRIGDARFDHGAQHFSARSASFRDAVDEWMAAGVVREWFRSASITRPERGIEPRHAGTDGIRGVAGHLAEGLDVRTEVTVERIAVEGGAVLAAAAGADSVRARAAIVTPPLPQLLSIVDVSTDPNLADRLARVEYDACLAVMARLDGPSGLGYGHAAFATGPIAWMADNQHKGISEVPALTIHSSPEFAASRLDGAPETWTAELVAAAMNHLRSEVTASTGHRWRYAQPRTTFDDGCAAVEGSAAVVLAGEVFAGAKVEGAYRSGRAAAAAVLSRVAG